MTDMADQGSKKPPKKPQKKPWGGRFAEATGEAVERFTASVDTDWRLWRQDIQGSIAHAGQLARIGVINETEHGQLVDGLNGIAADIEQGAFQWDLALEDVHMNIEAALTERIGEAGKKLHTARSRNDQVATDMRLWLREAIDRIHADMLGLQDALLTLAEREVDTVMPGFTHLQPAQPVSFGHHVMAWHTMIERDAERLLQCRARTNVMPLGSAALAGTSYPLQRERVAEELGFSTVSVNSLDAVSDRDFAIEFAFAAALAMTHLSRIAEELVLWSSPGFGFISLPDRVCTGSSIMPQKKNPDVPELIRGQSARANGHLVALLTLMRAQPLAYNRDNQEDKKPLFDAADILADCVAICAKEIIPGIQVNAAAMRAAASAGHATATDLADWLVRRGVPFRDAHEMTGRAVAAADERGLELAELSLETLRECCPQADESALEALDLDRALAARNHIGATAPALVRQAITAARARLSASLAEEH